MEKINEVYLKKRLKSILEISPDDGISRYFTGMYNYVSVAPKTNINADDYYLYVKVFNDYFKDDVFIINKFLTAIEQLLSKENIVDCYIAYEILIAQLNLMKNQKHSFEITRDKMIELLNRINSRFIKNREILNKSKYGMGELYDNGLEGVITSSSELIEKECGIKML